MTDCRGPLGLCITDLVMHESCDSMYKALDSRRGGFSDVMWRALARLVGLISPGV